MSVSLSVINAFIEDTCVLMVIAYLLARGKMLTLLVDAHPSLRRTVILGVILGLVGLTEAIFPGLRSPYVLHTLIITFATLSGGLGVGLIAVLTVLAGVAAFGTVPGVLETALTLTAGMLLAEMVRRLFQTRFSLLRGLTAGVCAQSGVVAMHQLPLMGFHPSHTLAHALVAIPANGFGVMLLQLLLNDARMRAASEQNRLEAERAHALVTEAQLIALRARVHPHFLFNALTSIAALCNLAPNRAETAVLHLSQLMRRTLEFEASEPLCLSEEIEYVRGYLEIEMHRYASRLQVVWEVDPAVAHVRIPAFALQTLVENAVGHGIGPKIEPGRIRIVARQLMTRPHGSYALIAVQDDGVGMAMQKKENRKESRQERREQEKSTPVSDRAHGLQILDAQLTLLYGKRGRLRLFSREEKGTLVAFAVPLLVGPKRCLHRKESSDADGVDRG